MTRPVTRILAGAAFLLLAGCSEESDRILPPPAPNDTITIAFQDGVSPYLSYLGTRDAILKDGPTWELRNGNFGHVYLDTLGACELAGEPTERRLLLRFDLSAVTNCASVVESRIELRIEAGEGDSITLGAFEAAVPSGYSGSWVEGFGGTGGGASWYAIDGAVPWETEGGAAALLP